MSLSDSERRSFEELEAQLRESDPDFARKISSNTTGKFSTQKIILGTLVFLGGIVALLLGIGMDLLILGVAGFVLMGAGAYIALTRISDSRNSSNRASSNRTSPSPFMQRLEHSWEERRRKEGR